MIRLGLVGVGRGSMVAQLAGRGDVAFSAVCDTAFENEQFREENLDRLAKAGAPFPAAYADYARFLEHDLDLVVVASPPPLHASQSIAALHAGKDVICEVPAVMSIEEGRALVHAVRATKRRYFFAENCCYWGFVRAWREMIVAGEVGTPYYLEGEYVHDVRYLMERGGKPTWRASFNPIRYCTHETGPLFDMLDDRAASVVALNTPSLVEPRFPAPDAGVALVTTTRGAVVKLLACFKNAMHGSYHRYMLLGTNGTLETKTTDPVTYASLPGIPHLQGQVKLPLGTALGGGHVTGGHGGADAAMLNDFIDSIAQDRPCPIDVYRGLDYTLPGVCAVLSAELGGTPVQVPDPREF
jgi:predicted dehydrogenase